MVGAAARPARKRRSGHRTHLAQRPATRAPAPRRALARPHGLQRGRGQRDPVAVRCRGAPLAAAAVVAGAEGRPGRAPAHRHWVANLHGSAHHELRARSDLARAARAVLAWAAGAPVILGGDLNLRAPELAGFAHLGGHSVDHVLARGVGAAGATERLARGSLSDHAPLRIRIA